MARKSSAAVVEPTRARLKNAASRKQKENIARPNSQNNRIMSLFNAQCKQNV